MTKEKGEYRPAIQSIPPADEQVAEILSDRQRHFEELRLSREERERLLKMRRREEERKRRAKQKSQAQKENRFHLLLPRDLKKRIAEIALEHGVSESQVVTFLLYEAIEWYDRGEVGFWGFKHPSKSPRYEFNLIHPKDTERESRKNEKSR